MTRWVRFAAGDRIGFGTLEDDAVAEHDGDMFAAPRPTGHRLPLAALRLLAPCVPGKIIGLWNNFREAATKFNFSEPVSPLYFLKAPSALLDPQATIPRPARYAGRVFFEGELGIVIGKRCADLSEADAAACVFGFTCVNDITAIELVNADASFPQWARAKGFDGFCPLGPAIATGLTAADLRVRTLVDGRERQNYPVSDMFFDPMRLVSLLSRDMTLLPGDVIACGTSLGASILKAGAQVDIAIEGIGTLSNVMGTGSAA